MEVDLAACFTTVEIEVVNVSADEGNDISLFSMEEAEEQFRLAQAEEARHPTTKAQYEPSARALLPLPSSLLITPSPRSEIHYHNIEREELFTNDTDERDALDSPHRQRPRDQLLRQGVHRLSFDE